MANQYCSYKLYKLQRRPSGSTADFEDVVPQVYSVDGDGTMPLVVKDAYARRCGASDNVEPQYRTVEVEGYICDECQ